jgi:hypothetical protein
MFVKAISEQNYIGDYFEINVGAEIWGNVRSYSQDFIIIREMYDNKDWIAGKEDENGCPENIEECFKYRNIKIKVKKGSIERLYCGCGKIAIREDMSEAFCGDCEYESSEDHSYLCHDSLDWAD